MKNILFLLILFSTHLNAQVKADLKPLYWNVNGGEVDLDCSTTSMSLEEMVIRIQKIEDYIIKQGGDLSLKYGILQNVDVSNFKALDEKILYLKYNTDILRRFSQSLKLPVTGTKTALIKQIKQKIIDTK